MKQGARDKAGAPRSLVLLFLFLFLFLAAVFVVKLTVALQLDKHPLLQPDTGLDTTVYVELAKRVASGDIALGRGLFNVPPLYVYFLAVVYSVVKSFTAARVVQALLGTIAIVLIFMTAREWFGRRAASISAALAALTGLFTYDESLLLHSSLDVFLTSAALWLLTLAVKRERTRDSLLAGLLFGVASLNRPNMLLAAGTIVFVLFVMRRFRTAAMVLAGVIAAVAPITIRNVVVAHQWALVTSHSGINFYIGNGEGATGYFHALPGVRPTIEGLVVDARRVAETATGAKLTSGQVSSYYSSLTWSWIRTHPGAWMRLMLRKTYALLNTAHVSTPFSYTFYAYDAGTLLRFLFVGPWLIVPLGLFGLVRGAPRPWSRAYIAWLTFVPAYAAAVVLFFITERYKLPLYVALTIGAGAAIEELRRTPHRVASYCVIAALLVAANWPLRLDDGRTEERVRMAEYHAARGEVDQAERWATVALTGPMDPASIHYRVGAQYINSQQAAPAIRHLSLASHDPRGEYLIGHALLGAGRSAEAVPRLQRAIERYVDVPLAGYDLAVALQQTGDIAGAVRALRDVKPAPDSPVDVWLQLGRRAAELNAPDIAEVFFGRAVVVAPDHAKARQAHALTLMALGRCKEAAAELGNNDEARKLLAYCGPPASRRPVRR